uniref:Protein kinase domain-containing protein n=1 Tax=Rhabditophanes sp. KR3021 TaxID=114890 RepID=A0AC35TQ75_9BILA
MRPIHELGEIQLIAREVLDGLVERIDPKGGESKSVLQHEFCIRMPLYIQSNLFCSYAMTDAQPIEPLVVNVGDVVRDTYIVKKKLGGGSCGSVYLMQSLNNVKGAMKCKDDKLLKCTFN